MTYSEAKAIVKHYRTMAKYGGDNESQMLHTILQLTDERDQLRAELAAARTQLASVPLDHLAV